MPTLRVIARRVILGLVNSSALRFGRTAEARRRI